MRPVVRVGVVVARPDGAGAPGRPEEEICNILPFLWIFYGIGQDWAFAVSIRKKVVVEFAIFHESGCLIRTECQRVGG